MQLTNYLQLLGTESLSFEQFRSRLQSIGSTLAFDVTPDAFVMKVTGFDNHIDETMELVGDFIRHAKADDKKLRQIVDDAKVSEKAFFKSGDNVASALLEQVKYGDQSRYLRKLSLSQIKKLKGKDLLAVYGKVRSVQCDLSLLRHIACRKSDSGRFASISHWNGRPLPPILPITAS